MNKKCSWFPSEDQIGHFCEPTCQYAEGIFLTFLLTLTSSQENLWEGSDKKVNHIFEKVLIHSYQNSNLEKAIVLGRLGIKYPKLVVSGKLAGCLVVEYPHNRFFTRRVINLRSSKVNKKIIIDKINGCSGINNKIMRGFKKTTKAELVRIVEKENDWILKLFLFCIQKTSSPNKSSIKNIYDNFLEYYG